MMTTMMNEHHDNNRKSSYSKENFEIPMLNLQTFGWTKFPHVVLCLMPVRPNPNLKHTQHRSNETKLNISVITTCNVNKCYLLLNYVEILINTLVKVMAKQVFNRLNCAQIILIQLKLNFCH